MLGTFLKLLIRLLLVLVPLALAGPGHAQTPATQTEPPALLVAKAQALLQERAAAYPGQARISVTAPPSFNQPICTQMEVFLAGLGGLQPRTSVGIRCLAPHPWVTYLQANVQIIGHYFVARHALPRGESLSADDVDTREGDLLRNRRLVTDSARVLGWITTRALRAGSPIESGALRDPNSVQRGEQVRTVARGSGFVVSSEGQALEAGSPGSQIQVRTTSGRIITGTVIDSHTVQVMM